MTKVLQYSAEFIQETGHTPSICLVLPFEPQINDKYTITTRLKSMLAKAEGKLLQHYSTYKALPVFTMMQGLISGINYTNYKKSIALLASPYASKLLYLNFPVEETIRLGEYLDIREVVKAKRKEVAYLVMVLGNHCARMYRGSSRGLTCIKYNRETGDPASGYGPHFLHSMDQGLGLMLEAYGLPVFILGQQQVLEEFKGGTLHAESIMGYLPGNFDDSTEKDILATLQPELDHWGMRKHQLLLQKINKAGKEGKLAYGVKEVWNKATHQRGQLLVIEENFMSPVPNEEPTDADHLFTGATDDPYNIKDLVEDIIEKVLKDGGEVEFVKQGYLRDFQKIALIGLHQE